MPRGYVFHPIREQSSKKKKFEVTMHNVPPLGATYTPTFTSVSGYAPEKEEIILCLYESDASPAPYCQKEMVKTPEGYFCARVEGDLDGIYYTYLVEGVETFDPYAKTGGINMEKGMVVDLTKTNPDGWEEDTFTAKPPVIWETHVRDFSVDDYLDFEDKGKFSAFRTGVRTPKGKPALVDYLKYLGITYVQLLPVMDYATVDERTCSGYNWGYDPVSYFALEGSYSDNPYDGRVRIKEFKTLVKTLHDNGIGVVMDVVYNHTYSTDKNPLGILAEYEYFRHDEKGERCNGSGCGNETKSENPVFRRLMIDSVCYFAKEYHIDGFRFDLMGLHDVDTMNALRKALDDLFPDGHGKDILTYGEPWYCFPPYKVAGADKWNVSLLDERIGMFNDDFRNSVRGSSHGKPTRGFVQGNNASIGGVLAGLQGGGNVGLKNPIQNILYCACHDDYTLFDQLCMTTADWENKARMHKISAFLMLSGVGVPFFQAGEEFLRTKGGNGNTYNAGDEINLLDWRRAESQWTTVEYYRGLMAIRAANAAFNDLKKAKESFKLLYSPQGVLAYQIGDTVYAVNQTDNNAFIVMPKVRLQQTCDMDVCGQAIGESKGGFVVNAWGVYAGKIIG